MCVCVRECVCVYVSEHKPAGKTQVNRNGIASWSTSTQSCPDTVTAVLFVKAVPLMKIRMPPVYVCTHVRIKYNTHTQTVTNAIKHTNE